MSSVRATATVALAVARSACDSDKLGLTSRVTASTTKPSSGGPASAGASRRRAIAPPRRADVTIATTPRSGRASRMLAVSSASPSAVGSDIPRSDSGETWNKISAP
ncbi:hypothetical protein [Nannocystis pusilla]|uniref:hypothetical protein n=1 Tax=Nannocystis pusilla TaxID=889268 RepID=UPI003B779200